MSVSVGVVFDCHIRNNGTAAYAHRAMKLLAPEVDAKHYYPQHEMGKHDFYFYVDDGLDYLKQIPPHPNAYWAIDTHLGYAYRLWKAKQFDVAFCAQKDAVEQFRSEGVNAHWLPLACHPEAHISAEQFRGRGFSREQLEKRFDIGFVGFMQDAQGPGCNSRIEYLDALQKAIPNTWIAVNCFFEEMSLQYVRSRIGFNISIKRDLNMRIWEIMSCAVPCLTNRNVEGIDDLLKEDVHYIGFEGKDEMIEKAKACLEGKYDVDRIRLDGHAEVRKNHTYVQRMREVIEVMKKYA